MHHAFRFSGCARGIKELDDVIGGLAAFGKQALRVPLCLPWRLDQSLLEAFRSAAPNHQHPLQMRQL